MSLFDLVNLGSRGLSTAQTQLDVVGQNVTNADTVGYTRKQVNQQAGTRIDQSLGQMGFGVDVVNIRRLRDELLDRQMHDIATEQGTREEADASLQSVQNILTEPAESGINNFMDKFWASWQDLANNPADQTARQAVSDAGAALAGRFRDCGTQFDQLNVQKNDEISGTVADINKLLAGIDQDNTAIADSEIGGIRTQANDTRDQRGVKFMELSKLMNVSYTEDAQGRYIITSAGSLLVSAAGAFPLAVDRSTYTLPDGTQTSQASVTLSSTHQPFEPQAGKLQSLFEARDKVIPKFQADLDDIARHLVAAVNEQHRQGYDLTGATGIDFFDPATTGASDLKLSATVLAGTTYIAAAKGGASQGLGAPLTTTVPVVGTALDLTTTNPNYRNLSQGSVVVTTAGPPPVQLEEGAGKDYVVDYPTGQIRFLTAATYPPGTAINVDFRYTTPGYNGQGDGGNALKIGQIADLKVTEPDLLGVNMSTLGDSYASMVGRVGAAKKESAGSLTTSNNLKAFFQKQIDQISGVSMDEELANMVKYQNSYQASAKYIGSVSQMMDTLLNIQ